MSSISNLRFGGMLLEFKLSSVFYVGTHLIQFRLSRRQIDPYNLCGLLALLALCSEISSYLSLGMFVSKVDRPNACTGTQVKNSAGLKLGKIWRGETKLVVKSQEEQIMLQV